MGANPSSEVNFKNFGQLDLMMISYDDLDVVTDVRSHLQIPLASHHFLVTVALQVQIGHAVQHDAPSKKEVANKFAVLLDEHMQHQMGSVDDGSIVANDLCNFMTAAFHDVAHTCLPSLKCKPQRPWISNATLQIIARRHEARQYGNFNLERKLTVDIKRSVNDDRARWAGDFLATGDWAQIRKLCRGFSPKKGRLLSKMGEVLDSDDRAETFAQHFEEAQWHTRTVTEPSSSCCLGCVLPVCMDETSSQEVIIAAKS